MSKTFQFLAILSLFSASFSFTQSNIKEDTPLIQAIKADNLKEVKRLLKSDVDVNELGQDYKTALDTAVEYGHVKIALRLIKYKAKVTSEDNQKYIKNLCSKKFFITSILYPVLLLISAAITLYFVIGAIFALAADLSKATMLELFSIYFILFGGFVGVCLLDRYTLSLPFQAGSWYSRSRQNWMLPV